MRARLLSIAVAAMAISFDALAAPLSFQLLNPTLVAPEAALLAGDVSYSSSVATIGDKATFNLDLSVGNAAGDLGTLPTSAPGAIISGLLQFFTGKTLGETLESTEWETEVYFRATLELTGDPGERALVTGILGLGGTGNHQIAVGSPLWLSTGSASSGVRGSAKLLLHDDEYVEELSLAASHGEKVVHPFPPDFSNFSLGSVTRSLDPFEMIVGDPSVGSIEIGALLNVRSRGTVDPACTHFIVTICDPTSGWSIAMTKGWFGLSLEAQPIPNPVPEPSTFALVVLALLTAAGFTHSRRCH